jgi:hypothetical protein
MPMTSRHSPGPLHTKVGIDTSHVRLRAHSGATASTCVVLPSGKTAQDSGVDGAGTHAKPTTSKMNRELSARPVFRRAR